MSEDGLATDEADLLDDGFGRDLGADLGGDERRTRRWSRRRRNAPADPPAEVPPPPPAPVLLVPPAESDGGVAGSVIGEPAPAADTTSTSDEALALVALLTGGKAPGSAEALKLAALLLGTEPPGSAEVAAPLSLIEEPLSPIEEPLGSAEVTAPAPLSLDEEPLGSVDLPWLDLLSMDEEPLGSAEVTAPAPPSLIEEPPASVDPWLDLLSTDEEALGSVDLPWLEPASIDEERPVAAAAPMPPPPAGERLASPEEIPPPTPDGSPGANGDQPAGDVGIFDLFGWPPPPLALDHDDIRSLNDTRPFPLPVGNHTAVHDLSALLALGLDPGPTHLGRPPGADGADLGEASAETGRRRITAPFEMGDLIFRRVAWAGGLSVLVIMAVVGLFLSVESLSALRSRGWRFLTTEEWQPDIHVFGIAAVLFYTVAIAAVALIVAVPLATGTALFITEMAPRRLRTWFVAMVDLMAAVPSIVYGLWGLFFLQGRVIGLSRWLAVWLGWIPFFKVDGLDPSDPSASQSVFTASTFVAGLVVALMVIPISCSIMREVFSQAPPGEREGAFALGATRWGMVRTVVLPFGRGGMIGAIMLGLGRALGETIAVYLLISPVFEINWHVLQTGSNSVATLIVLRQGDASGFGLSALMAAGLALFVMTLIVNFGASTIVARSRSGALSEA